MSNKPSNEEIQSLFKSIDLEWVGYKYRNAHSPLLVQCQVGHQFEISRNQMMTRIKRKRDGSSFCPQCRKENWIQGVESVEKFLEDNGYKVWNINEYNNENSVIEISCREGHYNKRKFKYFKKYPKCRQCLVNTTGWFDTTRNILKSRGIDLIYKIDSKTAQVNFSGITRAMTIVEISKTFDLDILEMWGYKDFEILRTNATRKDRYPIQVTCSNNHSFITKMRYLIEGHGCRRCAFSIVNAPESEIAQHIERLGFEVSKKNKSLLNNNQELDIYIPSIRTAINYVGVRWHSIEYKKKNLINKGLSHEKIQEEIDKYKWHHQNKALECYKNSIRLITIFESDYLHRRTIIYDIINDIIAGRKIKGTDLRYCSPKKKCSEPYPHYLDRYYREVSVDSHRRKYTIYDCGYNL